MCFIHLIDYLLLLLVVVVVVVVAVVMWFIDFEYILKSSIKDPKRLSLCIFCAKPRSLFEMAI